MYIPNFASSLIDANQLWDSKIKFKGVMIGNGVMLTNKYWRRQARNTFYSKHYFYGS
jgi:carboxypeptidase C (cathepsin A)